MMSQSDGVTIAESTPDAPGIYVSAEQKQQDSYSQGITAQQVQMTSGMQSDPYYFLRTPDLNIPAQVASTNPNYRIEEPRTTTVDSRGNIVIYWIQAEEGNVSLSIDHFDKWNYLVKCYRY